MSEPGMKLSKEQANEMTEFANNHSLAMDEMKKMMREHYFKDYMIKFKEDNFDRAKQTILVVKAQINAYQGAGDEVEGVVVHVTDPVLFKSNVGTDKEKVGARAGIFGIFDVEGKKKLINVTAFDGAIETAKKIPLNVPVMLTNVSKKENEYGIQYTFFESSGYKEMECEEGFVIDVLDEIETIYGDNILDPDKARHTIGKDKIVKGRVKDVYVRTGKNSGKPYGSYRIYDDSVDDADLKENPDQYTFMVMCDAGMVTFDSGSLCYFIGDIKESTNEQYPPSMWANIIVPILPIPRDPDEIKSEMDNARRKGELQTANVTIEEEEEEEVVVSEDDPLTKWDQ